MAIWPKYTIAPSLTFLVKLEKMEVAGMGLNVLSKTTLIFRNPSTLIWNSFLVDLGKLAAAGKGPAAESFSKSTKTGHQLFENVVTDSEMNLGPGKYTEAKISWIM